ncbi:hypothetical protein FHW79_003921 [Azospirillum sp. OGB3]|nr:hypothetical protein [Azospirillum sp. OGB3]MBB3266283.1 hypothetical protein [Azospirillum sp. OGB3]
MGIAAARNNFSLSIKSPHDLERNAIRRLQIAGVFADIGLRLKESG